MNKDLLELPSDHETSKMLQSLRDLSGRVIFEPVENVVQSASTKASLEVEFDENVCFQYGELQKNNILR